MSMRGADAAARDERAQKLPRWASRLLSTDPKTFAIAQQCLFSALVSFPVLILVLTSRDSMHSGLLGLGIALLLLTTVSVLTTPRHRVSLVHDLSIPTINIVALGLCRIATMPEGAPLSTLAFFPAMWLIARLRVLGLALAVGAVVLALTVPSIMMVARQSVAEWFGYLALPTVLVLVGMVMILLLDRGRALAAAAARDERLLAGVLENLPAGVLVMDAEGNDLRANRAQEVLHRIASPPQNADPTEAGHLIFTLDGTPIPVEDRPARRVIRGETFDSMVSVIGEPGRDSRIISISSRIITGVEGAVESRILIFTDVTEEHRATQAREEVIATVSHELRTPLTSILGYTDLCLEELDGLPRETADLLRPSLEIVERNAESLHARVEDLLLQQQARSGKLVLDIAEVDLGRLVGRCVESARSAAKDKGTEIGFTVDVPLVAELDPRRVEQVVDNIITNAVKYTQDGGRITVRAFPAAESVGFSVQDNGPGMDEQEQAQLFTPFFRGSAASSSTSSGAGLGLALTSSIVEAHRGQIALQSTPGEGSTFTVSFPAKRAEDRPEGETAAA